MKLCQKTSEMALLTHCTNAKVTSTSAATIYRGITLLSIAGKLYAKILVMLFQSLSEKHLPESQSGVRPSRGTSDMISTLRQIQEKCREQNLLLYICFVDFRKAFDNVPRDLLWRLLGRYGCPGKFINITKLLHEGMEAQVMIGGELSDTFPVTNGVKQGCTLSPTLFALYLAAVLAAHQTRCQPF